MSVCTLPNFPTTVTFMWLHPCFQKRRHESDQTDRWHRQLGLACDNACSYRWMETPFKTVPSQPLPSPDQHAPVGPIQPIHPPLPTRQPPQPATSQLEGDNPPGWREYGGRGGPGDPRPSCNFGRIAKKVLETLSAGSNPPPPLIPSTNTLRVRGRGVNQTWGNFSMGHLQRTLPGLQTLPNVIVRGDMESCGRRTPTQPRIVPLGRPLSRNGRNARRRYSDRQRAYIMGSLSA